MHLLAFAWLSAVSKSLPPLHTHTHTHTLLPAHPSVQRGSDGGGGSGGRRTQDEVLADPSFANLMVRGACNYA